MGKAIRASLLILVFACSAQAGYIPNDAPAPPPPPTSAPEEQSVNGWMPNGAAESLTQTALDLLTALPSLL